MAEDLVESEDYWRENLGGVLIREPKAGKKPGGLSVVLVSILLAAVLYSGFNEAINEALINPVGHYLAPLYRQGDSTQESAKPSTTSVQEYSTELNYSILEDLYDDSIEKRGSEDTTSTTSLSFHPPITSSSTIVVSSCDTACLKYFNESGECVDEPVSCRGNKNHVLKSASTYCESLSLKYDTCCCMGG